jgi:hypothetical protein
LSNKVTPIADAALPLSDASCATFGAIEIDISPAPSGVISAIYVSPSTIVKLVTSPLSTVISVPTNPVTVSVNCSVTVNGVRLFMLNG